MSIPGFAEAASAGERLDLVLGAVASGRISVEQGRDLAALVESRHALERESDVELRLTDLERKAWRERAA